MEDRVVGHATILRVHLEDACKVVDRVPYTQIAYSPAEATFWSTSPAAKAMQRDGRLLGLRGLHGWAVQKLGKSSDGQTGITTSAAESLLAAVLLDTVSSEARAGYFAAAREAAGRALAGWRSQPDPPSSAWRAAAAAAASSAVDRLFLSTAEAAAARHLGVAGAHQHTARGQLPATVIAHARGLLEPLVDEPSVTAALEHVGSCGSADEAAPTAGGGKIRSRRADDEGFDAPPAAAGMDDDGGDDDNDEDFEAPGVEDSRARARDRRYPCPHYDFRATTAGNLRRHVASVHEGRREHACPHCDYRAAEAGHLRRHVASVHEGHRDRACPLCDYRAARAGHLRRHVASVHKGRRDHACPHCDYRAATADTLRQHVASVHEGRRDHACPHCDYGAAQAGNLRQQVTSVQEAPLQYDDPTDEGLGELQPHVNVLLETGDALSFIERSVHGGLFPTMLSKRFYVGGRFEHE